MLIFCDQLKTNLLQNNTIFGNNGFYFRDRYEFISSGVSDRFAAMFYIRPILDGVGKYKVRQGQSYDQIQFDCRLIAQLPNEVDRDNAMQSLLAQLSENTETEILSFSDDTDGIYQTEYRKEAVTRDFYLLSIDFRVTEGATLRSGFCEPICIGEPEEEPEEPIDWDFEGALTIGEFEGEGEVMEYGYRSGWGDDYGSIANFYTYYEYAGLYWINGVLYVWGVDVDILQIADTNYITGTYSNGYTTFNITDNPLTGATIDIKIKGTNVETWDYEGVMTVGGAYLWGELVKKGYNTGYDISSAYGSMNPAYKYRYNGFGVIEYVIGDARLVMSGECQSVKINSAIYAVNTVDAGLSYFDIADPLPNVDETCTIKVKL